MKKDLDLREIITNQVIEGLEKAGSWKQLWNKTKNYYNPITKKHYSFMNSILLLVQMAGREKDNDNKTFMTFKEIQKISAKVNKGAKAYDIYLYLPCYYNKLTKQYLTYKEYMLLSDLEKKKVLLESINNSLLKEKNVDRNLLSLLNDTFHEHHVSLWKKFKTSIKKLIPTKRIYTY